MAFIFTMRSTSHRRDHSQSTSLPAISEDSADFIAPPVPVAPSRYNVQSQLRDNPRIGSPVNGAYSSFSDTSSLGGTTKIGEEKVVGIRDNEQIAKRGGWKRLALIALVVTICLVGLIVGLVVGLRNRNNGMATESPWSPYQNATINSTFPAGDYSIQTFLSSTSSDCTSNAATWRCYPYTTYTDSPTDSLTTLDWKIRAFQSNPASSPVYTVSSTNNPFSVIFSNITLITRDANTINERYVFNITMNKPVIPLTMLTSANVFTTCYYNTTNFQATLFTKTSKSLPANSTVAAYQTWPYAVAFEQIALSGSQTPQCLDASGNTVGSFAVSTAGKTCSCNYANYGA